MAAIPSEQYRMQLNTIMQARYATFDVKTWQTGSLHNPTWVAAITITSITPALSEYIYLGTVFQGLGSTKSAAKDAASERMLGVFAACGVQPSLGR